MVESGFVGWKMVCRVLYPHVVQYAFVEPGIMFEDASVVLVVPTVPVAPVAPVVVGGPIIRLMS